MTEAVAYAPEEAFRVVRDLVTSRDSVPSTTPVREVVETFFKTPHMDAMAVVDDGAPVGLVTRQKILFTLFRRYGFELHGQKAVATLADRNPVVVRDDERLDAVLDRAMARPGSDIYDDVIVVDGAGRFVGLLAVKQMVLQQSHTVANVIAQKELASAKAQELEKVSQMKSHFISHVTHELRSPVNAIIELGELIRMSAEKGYVEQTSDRLSLLLSSATNLRSIITNILDLSKIEAGKMNVVREPFDLVATLQEVVETVRVLVGRKPVDVVGAYPADSHLIVTDPVKLRQVLVNLGSNAAKFTEEGRIQIGFRSLPGAVEVWVADTGIGIAPQDLEKLFQAFSQIEDPRTRRFEGTGLGLTITKQLLDLLGGRVAVDSRPGEGSTFTVHLPAAALGSIREVTS